MEYIRLTFGVELENGFDFRTINIKRGESLESATDRLVSQLNAETEKMGQPALLETPTFQEANDKEEHERLTNESNEMNTEEAEKEEIKPMKTLNKVINLMNTTETQTKEIDRLKAIIEQQEQDLKEFREIQKILGLNTDVNTPETKAEALIIPSVETVIEAPETPFNAILEEDNVSIEPSYNPFSDEALQALDNEHEELTNPFDEEPSDELEINEIFPPLETVEAEETGEPKSLNELIDLLKEDEVPTEQEEPKVETAPSMLRKEIEQNKEIEQDTKDYTINPKDIFIDRLIPTIEKADKKAYLIEEILNKELNPINENNLMIKAPQMKEIKNEYSKLSKLLNRATTNKLKEKLNISKTFTIDSIPTRAIALKCMREINYILEYGELADRAGKEVNHLIDSTPNEAQEIEGIEPKSNQKAPKVQTPLSEQLISYLLNTQIEPNEALKKEIHDIDEITLITMFKKMVKNDLKSIFENQRNNLIKNKDMHRIYIEHGRNGDNTLQTRRGLEFFYNQIFDLMGFDGEIRKIVEEI